MSFRRANDLRSAERTERIAKTGRLLHQGYSQQQIADYFGVTSATARSYIQAAYSRGEVRETNHAWNFFILIGLITSFFLWWDWFGMNWVMFIIWALFCFPFALIFKDT